MIIYIDIDDTICTLDEPMNYSSARPIDLAVKKVNQLYSDGHEIHFWTARGTLSRKDWTKLTKDQLDSWGVNYHELHFGKPAYDLFIDDKNINSKDWLTDEVKY